jgi:D-3-phosphoglycerate dehydrogenase / 2-oxoglutarate reductase
VTFRVLVTDGVDPEGVAVLRSVDSFAVEETPTLSTADLIARIGDYDAFVGRSASRLSADVLRAAKKLRVVGRAGVGVDNIAMDVATEMGIAVINAPAGNTIAVAELVFGVLISLIRHISRADQSMHEGAWERDALMGTELRGKTLGIVGVGRIGSEVAKRARAFDMPLLGYDPYIGDEHFDFLDVTRVQSLEELLERSDVITVHTPLTDETRGLIGAAQLAGMKRGGIVLNLARGGIVDEDALIAAIRGEQISGGAIDAFSKEPLTGDHRFRDVPNLVLTPHLGASTVEAQRNVSIDVCVAVKDALLEGELSRSINVAGAGTNWRELQSALILARRSAAVARAWLADRGSRAIKSISLRVGAELQHSAQALMSAAAAGALSGVVEPARLNLVNARSLAIARGIELAVLESGDAPHPRALEVRVCADREEMRVGGVAMSGAAPRITRVGPFHVDVAPRGTLIVLTNRDVPGVIGRVGTVLGNAGVNIAEYHQARLQQGGDALAMISVDGDVGDTSRRALLSLPDVLFATTVTFNEGM